MFRHLLYPFLPYRSFFIPFLGLSAIAALCWLAFRLYRRRTPAHRLPLHRELLLLTVVVYLSGVAAATLTNSHPSRQVAEATKAVELQPDLASLTCSSATMPTGSTARGFCVRNARGNVVLFFPLGILIPLVWRRLRFWKGVLIAIGLSIGIELVQYLSRAWGSHRTADINDVILNVVGACLGLVLMLLLRLRRGTSPAVGRA